jgi:hypothetical protein
MNGYPLTYKFQVYGSILVGGTLAVLVLIFGFLFLVQSLKTDVTTVVLINFYGEEVIVEFDNKVIPLDVMEITRIEAKNLSDDKAISIKSAVGEELSRVGAIELSNTPNLVIEPINPRISYCFFRADVSEFYYYSKDESEAPHLKDISLLRKVSRSSNSSLFTDSDIVVYPGKASPDDLPGRLGLGDSIYGVYPIPCRDVTDLEAMKNTVIGFKNYDEEASREYVEKRVQEINDLDLSDVGI